MYFITICTGRRAMLFGEVMGGLMRLNGAAQAVQRVWTELPAHDLGVEVDAFIVMPNHVHGIIVLKSAEIPSTSVGAGLKPAPTTRVVATCLVLA